MAVIKNSTLTNSMGVLATANAAKTTFYQKGAADPLTRSAYSYDSSPAGLVVSGRNELGLSTNVFGADRFGNSKTQSLTPLLWEDYEGTTLNTQRWLQSAALYTPAQTALGLSLNSSLSTASGASAVVYGVRRVPKVTGISLFYRGRAKLSNFGGSVNELGLADVGPSTSANVAQGAFFQITLTGAILAVLASGSTYTRVPITWLRGYAYQQFATYSWDITIEDSYVAFAVKDSALGTIVGTALISMPLAGGRMFGATHLTAFNRLFTPAGGAAVTAPFHVVSSVFVAHVGMSPLSKPWSDVLALNNLVSTVNPITGAQAQTFANSAEPASMTLSNTTSGMTTLGGKFQFAAVAGAVTDYHIVGFSVPAPFTLVVKSITIDLWNTGVISAITPTDFTW